MALHDYLDCIYDGFGSNLWSYVVQMIEDRNTSLKHANVTSMALYVFDVVRNVTGQAQAYVQSLF